MRRYRIDELCLGSLIEFPRHFGGAVIVLAHGTDPTEFAIDIGFIRTDIPDDFAKFGYPVRVFRLLEAGGIYDKPLLGELDQNAGCPAAKNGRLG